MSKNKISKNNFSGFSLMELVVVMGITVVLASLLFLFHRPSSSTVKLESAQEEVATAIKLAQAHALQGKMQNNAVVCGYGFRFIDEDTYVIFYNTSEGITGGCKAANDNVAYLRYGSSCSGHCHPLETKNLAAGVTRTGQNYQTEIYFTLPNASIFYCQFGDDSCGSASAAGWSKTLTFGINGISRTVMINQTGLVTMN